MNYYYFCLKFISLMFDISLDHFTVVDLVPWPSSECEADGDLVLTQTSFAFLWKLSLKNISYHTNNLINIVKQEDLCQNKVTVSLASTHNCNMAMSGNNLVPRAFPSKNGWSPTLFSGKSPGNEVGAEK